MSALVLEDPGVGHPLFLLCEPGNLGWGAEEVQAKKPGDDGERSEELLIGQCV